MVILNIKTKLISIKKTPSNELIKKKKFGQKQKLYENKIKNHILKNQKFTIP